MPLPMPEGRISVTARVRLTKQAKVSALEALDKNVRNSFSVVGEPVVSMVIVANGE